MPSVAAALLVAMTEEAQEALGGVRDVPLTAFPVRVGRERRIRKSRQPIALHGDQRHGADPPLNDIYLRESGESKSLHISGEHFAIEVVDDRFVLVDRGSACGTIVAGRRVGGNRKGGVTDLCDGDEIVVGTAQSRYVFRFTLIGDDLGHA